MEPTYDDFRELRRKRLRHQGPSRVGVGGENNGFDSHTCGGLFAFGNKERNDKRKARVGSRGWCGNREVGSAFEGARYANNGEIMYRLQ
ncbi:unnamed protein product [Pieris brassicae]|uniref:Uncharacterized protein n=1 Tax=Pieris brassicae TaxID=7116 RepID=A0A9P0TGG0_PIEBR|nr:unnamed protein product [Pieris brassicae]